MAKTALIVDDSGVFLRMLESTLWALDYEVTEASDGQEALEKARLQHFDLVLTDQNMPRMDGVELIKGLRTLLSYRNVPILMITTETSDELKAQAKEAGATGWLHKPTNPGKLLEILSKIPSSDAS